VNFDPTDIIALVLMAMFAMRRVEVRSTDPRAFPSVSPADFDAWKAAALHARNVSVNACFFKLFVNTVWFFGFRNHVVPKVLQTGGALIFFGWIAALVYAWWRASTARGRAEVLGIVIGRRLVPAGEAAVTSPGEKRDQEAASSR